MARPPTLYIVMAITKTTVSCGKPKQGAGSGTRSLHDVTVLSCERFGIDTARRTCGAIGMAVACVQIPPTRILRGFPDIV